MIVTAQLLRELFAYDPSTGLWYWLKPPKHNRKLAGKIAGHVRPDGYRTIRIGGLPYYSSRLAFLYMTGRWPKEEMDHIDRDPRNDRWSNLREASSSLNKSNQSRWFTPNRAQPPTLQVNR